MFKRSKEITPDKFAGFLAWLAPDAETAGVEYERLRFRLINFFANRNCRFAEDLTDETINRVTLKIGAETIENKLAFVYGFAKNIYLESIRKEKNHLNIDEINVAEKSQSEDINFSNEHLEKCLNELSLENRSLILDYFSEDKQAKIDLHKRFVGNIANNADRSADEDRADQTEIKNVFGRLYGGLILVFLFAKALRFVWNGHI